MSSYSVLGVILKAGWVDRSFDALGQCIQQLVVLDVHQDVVVTQDVHTQDGVLDINLSG